MKVVDLGEYIDTYDALLVDVDGVLCHSDQFFSDAIDSLNSFRGKNIFICTNSVRRTPDILARRLRSAGLDIEISNIFTGATSSISYLNQYHTGALVYLLGCDGARTYYEANGIQVASSIPESDLAVIGAISKEDMNFGTYTSIANRHAAGHVTIATSEDLTVPDREGKLKLATGFLARFLKQLSPDNYRLVGKPSEYYFRCIIDAALKAGAHRMVMIGDTYETDIVGALSAGIDALYIAGEARQSSVWPSCARTERLSLNSKIFVDDQSKNAGAFSLINQLPGMDRGSGTASGACSTLGTVA